MFFRPQECFLMVIDPQEKLLKAVCQPERVVKNVVLLIKASQEFGVPIVATTQYRKGLGDYVPEVKQALENLEPLDKTEFSALKNPAVAEEVQRISRSVMIVCGVETHICVYQTALSALERDFQVVVVGDATSSRSPENISYGLSSMREVGVAVVSTEMLIYEWLEKAGTPAFKALLPYFKKI